MYVMDCDLKEVLIEIRQYVIKLKFWFEVAAGDLTSSWLTVSSQFHHVTQKMRETRGDTGNIATKLHHLP